MTARERLLGIPELNVEQILIHMRDNRLDEYIQALKSFVEDFPIRETELKNTLEAKDYLAFSRCFAAIRDMLIKIHAGKLADECQKLINGLVAVKHEKVEAHMTYLLSLLTMLSIDIQMAIYKDMDGEESMYSENSDKLETGKKSILAVDDNAYFLDALNSALQGTNYKLICVNSGSAALKFIQNRVPDLFILDIEMPEMDGYELAQKIRENGKKAPILFLTGNATREYVTKAIKAGAADFIVKPITKEQVLERIDKFI